MAGCCGNYYPWLGAFKGSKSDDQVVHIQLRNERNTPNRHIDDIALVTCWELYFAIIFYLIGLDVLINQGYANFKNCWAGHRYKSLGNSHPYYFLERSILVLYSNFPTRCGKSPLRAFLSWIDGIALNTTHLNPTFGLERVNNQRIYLLWLGIWPLATWVDNHWNHDRSLSHLIINF